MGESTLFEGWSDEKLNYCNFDPDESNHTHIGDRPAILLVGYCNQRTLYLTRHDILFICRGEVEMHDTEDNNGISSSANKTPKRKKEQTESGLEEVIKLAINLYNSGVLSNVNNQGVTKNTIRNF